MTSARSWAKHVGPWFWAKAALLLAGVLDAVASGRLSNTLTTQRPSQPLGLFTVPFQTHGGVTYISRAEQLHNRALLGIGVLIVLAYWLIEHFEKRARTR